VSLASINEILARRSGFKFLTKIDISMHFYTFELGEESQAGYVGRNPKVSIQLAPRRKEIVDDILPYPGIGEPGF
jgi:hypothetical protein